jgi:hypothetical protein
MQEKMIITVKHLSAWQISYSVVSPLEHQNRISGNYILRLMLWGEANYRALDSDERCTGKDGVDGRNITK